MAPAGNGWAELAVLASTVACGEVARTRTPPGPCPWSVGRAVRGQTGCHTLGTNQLVLTGPLDAFYLRAKVAVVAGAILSSPVWLYQIWAFVAPGLHAREKRWSYVFLGTAVPLFLTGVTLAYWSLGRSMHYLLGLTPNHVSNLIQVDQYIHVALVPGNAHGVRPRESARPAKSRVGRGAPWPAPPGAMESGTTVRSVKRI